MKILQALMWVSAAVVGLALLGCDVFVRESASRGTVYVAQQQPEYVIVREAPPQPVVERRPSRPSPGHIWIDGYWDWNGRRYVWEPGHWAIPPHEHAVWVAPRYEKDEKGYRYTPGRWQEEQRQEQKERKEEDKPKLDRH
jgi:hypothetical protein